MTDPLPPVPVDPRAARRSKIIIASLAGLLLVGVYALSSFTGHVARLHEQKVLAGDYPHVHLEQEAATVEESGEVEMPDRRAEHPRYVASLKLVPPGKYQAILVAHDGDSAHRKKSELVIGARDARGAWHPPSAAQILERLEVPRPGQAQ